jgi:hypothetical protein
MSEKKIRRAATSALTFMTFSQKRQLTLDSGYSSSALSELYGRSIPVRDCRVLPLFDLPLHTRGKDRQYARQWLNPLAPKSSLASQQDRKCPVPPALYGCRKNLLELSIRGHQSCLGVGTESKNSDANCGGTAARTSVWVE